MSLRMFICAYAHDTVFYACSLIHIYIYTCTYLILDLLLILWFLFMLLVIAYTYVPELYYLIMCVVTWTRQLASSYVLVGLLSDNHGPSCPDPGAWTMVAFCSWSECAVKAWISGCLSRALFSSSPLDRLARFLSCYSLVFFSLFILHNILLRFLVI